MATTKQKTTKRSLTPLFVLVLMGSVTANVLLYQKGQHQHQDLQYLSQNNQQSISEITDHLSQPYSSEKLNDNHIRHLLMLAELEIQIKHQLETGAQLFNKVIELSDNNALKEQLIKIIDDLQTHPAHKKTRMIQKIQSIKEDLTLPEVIKPGLPTTTELSQPTDQSWLDQVTSVIKKAIIIRETTRTITPIPEDLKQALMTSNLQLFFSLCQQSIIDLDNDSWHYALNHIHDQLLHQPLLSEHERQALALTEAMKEVDLNLPKIDFNALYSLLDSDHEVLL